MKARGAGGPNRGGGGGVPTDLLVCFPSRSHLALLPKAISYYSPSRHTDTPPTRRLPSRLQGGSPLFKTQPPSSSYKNKSKEITPPSHELLEPTSPKVTCAGQIKVRHGSTSVQVGNARRRRPKRQQWLEALGIKRDVMHILEALRGRLRFSFACFHGAVDCTTDEEEEDEVEGEEGNAEGGEGEAVTRWFMLLEEKHRRRYGEGDVGRGLTSGAPPANATILMRCRSAPTREWEERRKREEEERVMVTGYEVVKETRLVDGGGGGGGGGSSNGVFARSRSCRR